MPHAAGRHVVPGLLVDVVGHGQHLQAAALQRREEVVDVLPAHHVGDGVLRARRPGRVSRTQPAVGRRFPPGTCVCRSRRRPACGVRFALANVGRVGLHGQAVPRRGPELVEIRVAIAAGLRADELGRARAPRQSEKRASGTLSDRLLRRGLPATRRQQDRTDHGDGDEAESTHVRQGSDISRKGAKAKIDPASSAFASAWAFLSPVPPPCPLSSSKHTRAAILQWSFYFFGRTTNEHLAWWHSLRSLMQSKPKGSSTRRYSTSQWRQ